MSNFRNTPDLVDGVLRRCGELTSDRGVSPYVNSVLLYLNQIHSNLITGGSELNIEVDEPWIWARARRPVVIQLNPAITTGTVALSYGSVTGTFSTAPQVNGANISVEGWFLRPTTGPECYKVVTHTSGATGFSIDAPFPQGSNAGLNFYLFQLDYDVVTNTLVVDSENDSLDFIESGTTVRTATLAHGAYSPTALATQTASALNTATAVGNTYTCTYDSLQRIFTVSSNLNAGSSIFTLQGAGTNAYRSGWSKLLGFDYLNASGTASYTGLYPLSAIIKFTQPARIYYGQSAFFTAPIGQVGLVDPVAFDRDYPIVEIKAGTPNTYCVVRERTDGTMTIRVNRYPMATTAVQSMRMEFDVIEYPKDLQNNTASIPIFPRKFLRILEFGASYYLSNDKSDYQRAQNYLQMAQTGLNGLIKFNRKELEKAGRDFGNVIARADLMPNKRHYRLNNYGYTAEE